MGQFLLAASYASTLTGTPTEYEFYYSTALYVMLSVSGVYTVFWLLHRGKTARLLQHLLELTEELEVGIDDEEIYMSKSTLRTMMMVVRGFQMTFVFEVFTVCGQPVMDARLPPFMRGMKAFSPEGLLVQGLHLFAMVPIAITTCGFLIIQTQLACFLTVGFQIIGMRLRRSQMTDHNEVRDILRLHSEWVSVSADCEKLFAMWNFSFVADMITIALLSTIGIISGVTDFEIVILGPSVGSYVYVLCQLGEILQAQSILIADAICEGYWLNGTGKLRKLLLLPIMRANRPSKIGCTLIGDLTLKTFLKCLKQWYRFLQFMLNMESG